MSKNNKLHLNQISQVENREMFEYWLCNMDEHLDFLFKQVPLDIRNKLDFSANSLKIIESWILDQYQSIEKMLIPQETSQVNSLACYIGETFRKNLGGKWDINLTDPKDVYFKIPILTGFTNESSPLCPLTLATALVDRKTGTYLFTILHNIQQK